MSDGYEPQETFDNSPPKEEEIIQAITEGLVASGVDPSLVDIIPTEHFLPQYDQLITGQKKAFPVFTVVVKSSGMIIWFAAAGPAGIHARIIANRQTPN